MNTHTSTLISRRKWILFTVSLPILVALWWAFRPEKLWINERVNEPAPFDTSADPEPIFTGRFDRKTGGRVTVFKKSAGEEYLRLSDLKVPGDAGTHVVLARSDDLSRAQNGGKAAFDSIDLGPLKSNQGDQNFDLPSAADLNKYGAVLLYSGLSHTALGVAKLEPF